jgi:SAM-dependent methyltransferase
MPDAGTALDAGDRVRSLGYLVHGPSYKNAALNLIFSDHFRRERTLSIVDQGSGPGFVPIELALENPRVRRAVGCDIDARPLSLTADLYAHYRASLRGRFGARIGSAQEAAYVGPVDAVSFIGSLLYVPREARQAALDRAWQALAPGGLLIVHENMRHPSYVRDHDLMFTPDEIDALLGRYGHVSYYGATAIRRFRSFQVGARSVFRVVVRK